MDLRVCARAADESVWNFSDDIGRVCERIECEERSMA